MTARTTTYRVISNAAQTLFGIEMISGERVAEVFTNLAVAQRVAERLNRLKLSPLHFYDVMRDILVDFYCFQNVDSPAENERPHEALMGAQLTEQEHACCRAARRSTQYEYLSL